jgi:hypothetical protein
MVAQVELSLTVVSRHSCNLSRPSERQTPCGEHCAPEAQGFAAWVQVVRLAASIGS